MDKGPFNLSEMFIVRKTYPRKAERYVRLHGNMAFSAAGLSGDVLYVIRKHGLVPKIVYDGHYAGQSQYDHKEMDSVLKAALDAIINNKGRKLSKAWPKAIESILDAYLGKVKKEFDYQGKTYTPLSFRRELGFNSEDYVQLTSYTHHPFFRKINLEVPDNWSLNKYLNIPLDSFMMAIEHAVKNGYSLAWDGDITEQSFKPKKGVAILPLREWQEKDREERSGICDTPEPEKAVTQEFRQEAFDNYTSTDDHLMHIVGTAHDQNGTRYYKAKNSWGVKGSRYKGFIYLSESYMRAKTISVVVHKKGLPPDLARLVKDTKTDTDTSVGETWFFTS